MKIMLGWLTSRTAIRVLLLLGVMLFYSSLIGQVYNYLPLSVYNIETNPSFVAADQSKFLVNSAHVDNLHRDDRFSYNTILISKNLKSIFSGVGLSVGNTTVKDSINYRHIGVSFAYRNVLFNHAYIRLGINYKLIDVNAPSGEFFKYGYIFKDSIGEQSYKQNANMSLTLASGKDDYYVTVGWLNVMPFWLRGAQDHIFPGYFYMRIGNLAQLAHRMRFKELSLLFVKESIAGEISNGYYLKVLRTIKLNRRRYPNYGIDIGYHSTKYFVFRPIIDFPIRLSLTTKGLRARRIARGGFLIVRASSDICLNVGSDFEPYKPACELSLMLNF